VSEILKYQGKLLEKEHEAKTARLRMDGLVISLRDLLDPTDPVDALDTEQIADQALALRGLAIDLSGITAEIAKIKKLIGK